MGKQQKPKSEAAKQPKRTGPSAAKLRRKERQADQQMANKGQSRKPWDIAQEERQRRHRLAVADGTWVPTQRTELGFLCRRRPGGGIMLEDPGDKIRDRILRERAG